MDSKKKVLVAMSGGVDSSVTAKLLLDAGYEVAGATMHLYSNDDIGIEQAKPPAIRAALEKVRTMDWEPKETFKSADLIVNGLSGTPEASDRRARLGAALGVGFANAKTFLLRLNHYGVTREEFDSALERMNREEAGK